MIKVIFKNKSIVFGLIIFASAFALSLAFIGEHIFNLQPCNLCIYQRYPFAIAIILAMVGAIITFVCNNKKAIVNNVILCLLAVNFLVNSLIAFYHTGVEQGWWKSIFEACIVPVIDKNKSLLENIMGTPLTSCTDIQWVDPIFGFSMANYNIIYNFALFIFCILGIILSDNSYNKDNKDNKKL